MARWPTLKTVAEAGAWAVLLAGCVYGAVRMTRQFRWAAPRSRFVATVDSFYQRKFPAENLYIRFEDLNPDRDGEFIFVQFVRASYALHPRKVFVAPPGVRLAGSGEILTHNQLPPDDWLRAHGVGHVLTYSGGSGQPAAAVRRVEPVE